MVIIKKDIFNIKGIYTYICTYMNMFLFIIKGKQKETKTYTNNGMIDYLSLLPQVELHWEVVLLRESAISFLAVDRRSVDMLFLTDEK